MKTIQYTRLLLCAGLLMAVSACGEAKAEPGHGDDDAHSDRHNFGVSLDAGHAHIFSETDLTFTVRDLDDCTTPDDQTTCEPVAGLPVIASYMSPHADEPREQELEAGVLVDNGDGTYTWTRSFGELGGHMVSLKFEDDGQMYFSAFPLNTSKAGGERFFCDTAGDSAPEFAYQIRWSASTGHPHSNGESISFDIELMRSFNSPVNVDEPWTNKFNHLLPAVVTPTVDMVAEDGTQIAALTTAYQGKGVYQVSHTFASGHMGGESERNFWLDVSFTDEQNCTVTSADEKAHFMFPVSAPH